MAHQYVSCLVLDPREIQHLRLNEEAPSVHSLHNSFICLQHLNELLALLDLDRSVGATGKAHLPIRLKVVHDLIGESDEATLLWHQVHDLLACDIEDNKHGLIGLDDFDFMLAAQVVCKADVKLVALTVQRESRLWCLVKGDIINAVCPVVVYSDNVLSDHSIESLTFVVASARLIRFSDYANLVEDAHRAADDLMLRSHLQHEALFANR